MVGLCLNSFDFALIPIKSHRGEADGRLLEAFDTWRSLWSATFSEVGDTLNLADFYACDAVAVLSFEGQVVALSLLNWLDLVAAEGTDKRWHALIPEQMLSEMLGQGHRHVLMGNYFAVRPEWRRANRDFPTKLILMALITHCLLNTHATMLVGVMRRLRGMSALGLDHGARALQGDGTPLVVHGEPADVVTMGRDLVPPVPDEQLDALVHQLWRTRRAYDLPAAAASAAAVSRIAS